MSETLADLLADVLERTGPSAGSALARRVKVRKSSVLHELNENPRFERLGSSRGSRWLLAREPQRRPWEPLGTNPGADLGRDADRLAALDHGLADALRRLGLVERQLARNGHHRTARVHVPADDGRRFR